ENEKAKVAAVEAEIEQLEDDVFQKENQIIALQKNIGDVQYSVSEQQAGNSGALAAYINALQGSIARWKQAYLLIAPIAGNVSLNSNTVAERQFVKNGEVVLTLVPPSSDTLFGRMSLRISGSGKVEEKQRVIIKLDNYPYHEYGTVEGIVLSKSLVPRDNAYRVQVLLKNGLRSSYGRELTFQQQLQGNAEIVTEEKSFLRRITDQVFAGRKKSALGKD
ncbi:MAG: HlyD family secretion protein, partial [Saprospiraceae bacterium]